MKTVYIAKAKIPSTSANSVHVMKISEAFAKLCEDFELIVPEWPGEKSIDEDGFAYYGVEPFKMQKVNVPQTGIMNRYGFPIKSIWRARKARRVITRDPIVAFLAVVCGKQAVLDLHGDLKHLCGRAYRIIKWKWFVNSKRLHLVMISAGLQRYYRRQYNLPEEQSRILADGYTADDFARIQQTEILQGNPLNIGYCGSFLKGKGLGIICRLAQMDNENRYHLFGGTKEAAERELGEKIPDNICCHGYISHAQIAEKLNEQDILLLPNQMELICKGENIGEVTSPLKMFEYMASGRVIIASDLQVLREILNETNCYFANPDDADSWRKVMEYIAANREEAVSKAQKAKQDVRQYTWKIRAEKMLELTQ